MKATRRFALWFDGAAVVVALVAAVALTITVLVARKELERASLALVRGEGEALISRLHEQGRRHDGPPDQAFLEEQLESLRPEGLRYIAFPHRGLAVGASRISDANPALGTVVMREGRGQLSSPIPGRPGKRPPPTPPIAGEQPRIIIEFEPSALVRVNAGMDQTTMVAAIAVLVLLGLASTLSIRLVRRRKEELKADQERKLATLGQMAGVMAHELRNPLASLKGHAQLLAEMLQERPRELAKAEVVVREAERLERLTQDLLAFVRDGAIALEDVPTSELLEHALRDVAPQRVDLDLTEAPLLLHVDKVRISAAISNLVRNALQATTSNERVHVRVAQGDRDVLVEVRDRGPGIAPGDEERIFEPFFTTQIHGTGLGLAVARRAVEGHGGSLHAVSSATGGGVFQIRLPKRL